MNEIAWAHSPNDLHNLLALRPSELRIIYCDESYWKEYVLKWESVRTTRKKWVKRLKKGVIRMPERSEPYTNPENERERVAARRQRIAPKTGAAALSELISAQDRKRLHDQLDKLIDDANLPPETISQIRIKKISRWDMGYKDNDGEAQSHPLFGIQLEADPKKFEPKWPIPTRVESLVLPKRESKKSPESSRTAIILPDLQIPFVDENALSVALQVLNDVKPDKIIFLGDTLDLAAWGRYIQRPEWGTATQDSVNQLHKLLAGIRKAHRTADIVVLAGNHEQRMANNLLQNAAPAYGLKRADQLSNWPVMSVPYLCAFDHLDVEYIDGYPANKYWINERLQVRHGHIARSGGSTAKAVSNDERVSTIFGHVHRIETQYQTKNVYQGGRTNFAHTPGCLCRIDGHVPSAKGGYDQRTNQPVENYENWQNGFCIVNYHDGDSPFSLEQVYINTFNDYETMYRGKTYKP